jgi:CheY-like chemotaxis protein
VERLPIILCIDDDAASLAIRKLLLEANGYSVLTATDGAMGITMARELY